MGTIKIVAPRRGARIEIKTLSELDISQYVAPRRGAWIEISRRLKWWKIILSRSPQGSVD